MPDNTQGVCFFRLLIDAVRVCMYIVFASIFGTIAIIPKITHAGSCESVKPPCDKQLYCWKEPGPNGYKPRDSGDICEGKYRNPKSQVSKSLDELLNPIGYHYGSITAIGEKAVKVLFSWAHDQKFESLHIRAVHKSNKRRYQMDSILDPDSRHKEWPLQVVQNLGYRLEDLRILLWGKTKTAPAKEGLHRVIIPLRFNEKSRSPVRGKSKARFFVRASHDLSITSVVVVGKNKSGGEEEEDLFRGRRYLQKGRTWNVEIDSGEFLTQTLAILRIETMTDAGNAESIEYLLAF